MDKLSDNAIAILEMLASRGVKPGDVVRLEIEPGKWIEVQITRKFRRYLASRGRRLQ
jgi:hypothetical protein